MRNILFFIAFAAMTWSACQKSEIPPGGTEDPVFSLSIGNTIDSNQLTAGVNGIYLFTKVDRGADEVLVMSGAFADADCPDGDCPGSVQFVFRSENTEPGVPEPQYVFGPNFPWAFKSPEVDTPFLRTVTIQWVRDDGVLLRSDFVPQPDSLTTYFKVLGSSDWELNEKGEKTRKMDVDFACWMWDSIQGFGTKVFGTGVIAVGYR